MKKLPFIAQGMVGGYHFKSIGLIVCITVLVGSEDGEIPNVFRFRRGTSYMMVINIKSHSNLISSSNCEGRIMHC